MLLVYAGNILLERELGGKKNRSFHRNEYRHPIFGPHGLVFFWFFVGFFRNNFGLFSFEIGFSLVFAWFFLEIERVFIKIKAMEEDYETIGSADWH